MHACAHVCEHASGEFHAARVIAATVLLVCVCTANVCGVSRLHALPGRMSRLVCVRMCASRYVILCTPACIACICGYVFALTSSCCAAASCCDCMSWSRVQAARSCLVNWRDKEQAECARHACFSVAECSVEQASAAAPTWLLHSNVNLHSWRQMHGCMQKHTHGSPALVQCCLTQIAPLARPPGTPRPLHAWCRSVCRHKHGTVAWDCSTSNVQEEAAPLEHART